MNEPKRPYLKPELVQVPLRPDEAVLAACKTLAGGGGTTSCHATPNPCNTNGS